MAVSLKKMAVGIKQTSPEYDPVKTDPPLLARHSEVVDSFTTSRATYPKIRVFYRKHQQADQLPTEPSPIPLLVFIHGLGGSVAQFNKVLTSLTSIAPCLAVDLPGCGRSKFSLTSWDAYTSDALVELLETVIDKYREDGQRIILIGHSMGASLAALLANPRTSSKSSISRHVLGLVAICPPASPPTSLRTIKLALCISDLLFDLFRAWDRRGGLESASVRRFVGPEADEEAKRLQNLFNNQSRTPVWRRMAYGALPKSKNGSLQGGMATPQDWSGLNIPVYLIGGEIDHVTPPSDIQKIVAVLEEKADPSDVKPTQGEGIVDAAAPIDTAPVVDPGTAPSTNNSSSNNKNNNNNNDSNPRNHVSESASSSSPSSPSDNQPSTFSTLPPTPSNPIPSVPEFNLCPKKCVKSTIIPKSGHGLLFTAPTLPGLISDFLSQQITPRLSLAWQLQYLCRDGKWDVKNYEKWLKVPPVSDDIAGVFRAIKTLRGPDEVHCPRVFVKNWGAIIKDVIDISHDNPAYDPELLRQGGVRYHKFPTLSKVPPTEEEIRGFVGLVDEIREKQRQDVDGGKGEARIGVHCHYGFNRTGFLVVCYLVERCGYTVREAIDEFKRARKPDGIRHAHFVDGLYMRYAEMGGGGEQGPREAAGHLRGGEGKGEIASSAVVD
ncbi:hypothetical protein QBC42DRAFT_59763 [Cladorrhinum samala]|uniref:Tyrosine specific protein phosphatases domain-containing protein n=1 Tax=Cladorrhinum samala TaxID=585594 RepID=A0AAV9H7K7_9PEZI|nr:hypothetical protein QBC42DRAFT_59763 [Cladorrhinum samala]